MIRRGKQWMDTQILEKDSEKYEKRQISNTTATTVN